MKQQSRLNLQPLSEWSLALAKGVEEYGIRVRYAFVGAVTNSIGSWNMEKKMTITKKCSVNIVDIFCGEMVFTSFGKVNCVGNRTWKGGAVYA